MTKGLLGKKGKIGLATGLSACILLGLVAFTPKGQGFERNEIEYDRNEMLYLSDIDYIASMSKSGYGSFVIDKTPSNADLTLKIENSVFSFPKGIWAHATSTLVYDLEGLDYNYFTSFIGINSTASASTNGVKFFVYTSVDGKTWDLKTDASPGVTNLNNASLVTVDIKGAKYLKLYVDSNGGNGNDHSIFADAKLVKELDTTSIVPTVAEYDAKIKTFDGKDLAGEYELTLLQRQLVSNVGSYTINRLANESIENKEMLSWLMNDLENLREFMLGGTPEGGSYYNALTVLSRLYKNYKSDLDNKTLLNNKWDSSLTYSDLYRKMMFAISLTHSQNVGLWMQASAAENKSDPVRRYAIFRYLHKNGKFVVTKSNDKTPWFEYLRVEEMRFIMNNLIDDEEIIWLNAYVQSKIDAAPNSAEGLLTPHSYIAYVWPNYGNPIYYDPANVEYFNDLFAIPDGSDSSKKIGMFDASFTIPGGVDVPEYTLKVTRGTADYKLYKVWMNFRNKFGTGAVCGGISKSGSNIRATHGIPATVIGQPGHAALLYYTKNTAGQGYWGIDNDVSGWTLSEKGERMLLGWGNAGYQRGYSVVYMVLAQEAINDYDNLVKAEEYIMLAKTYEENLAKQEELYRKALSIQPINIDAWYGLIQTYNASNSKTEKEYYDLAAEIADALMAFPLPMYHLTNLINAKLTSVEYKYLFTLLQTRTLTEGSTLANGSDLVLQPGVTRTEANYLLGKIDKSIATFSFDGEQAGKIVLSSRFDGSGVRWDYSLDGKNTWKEVSFTGEEEHSLKLTEEEIESITAENDIYVHIVGVNYSEENLYKIDILKQNAPAGIYNNDLENKVVGVTDYMEWRMKDSSTWTLFKDEEPDLTGDKTVIVRARRHDIYLTSEEQSLEFTTDIIDEHRKYVSIKHLSIAGVSSEATAQGRYAKNIIDGNIYTNWHSAWNGSDLDKYIIIKLDRPIYLSALEYLPVEGGNGKILTGEISGSMDGENFTEITTVNWANNDAIKTVEIDESVRVKYIKIKGVRTSSASSLSFIAAKMFNIYEDTTKIIVPTASIEYDKTTATNQDVTVKLINPSTEITMTNNDGKDTYTFTENGEFTFVFVDKDGNVGSTTAKVDWIDKIAPTAGIAYNITTYTTREVIASLVNISEDIIITNNDGKNTYTFKKNGEFTFTFKDKAGNEGSVSAKVDWIDSSNPTAEILYSTTDKTSEPVKVSLVNASRPIKVVNNKGQFDYTFTKNGEFTFEFIDEQGRLGKATAKVDWIETTEKTPTNSETNKPETSDKTNQNTNSEKEVENSNSEENNISVLEKDRYTYNNITLELPKNTIKEKVILKTSKLPLTEEIKSKIKGDLKYFDIYFLDEKFQKSLISSVDMTLTIVLDKNKEFLGIYEVDKDKNIKELEYKKIDNQKIEIKQNAMKEYIIAYKEEAEINENEQTTNDNSDIEINTAVEENIDYNFKWLPVIVIFILLTVAFLFKKNNKKNY